MKKLSLIALLSTVSLSAFAVEPCKPYMSVNAGYAWGFNGKSTYTTYGANFIKNSTKIYTTSFDKQPQGIITNINLGYGFNDAMRAEIGLDWNPKMKSTVNVFNLEVKEIGSHGTVAYDFNNNTAVTPFLFGSLGFVSAEATIKPSTNAESSMLSANAGIPPYYLYNTTDGNTTAASVSITSKKSATKTLMTYKVGMGLAMKAGQDIDLEVRYGLGGKTQSWTPITDLMVSTTAQGTAVTTADELSARSVVLKNMMEHSVTAGVRFTF